MRQTIPDSAAARLALWTLLAPLFAALICVSPASAQDKPVFTSPEGPGYEVFEGGKIVIGGDVVGDCRSLLEDAREVDTENSREISRQVRVCTQAGFPPRGSSLPDSGGPSIAAAAVLLLGCGIIGLGVSGFRQQGPDR